MQCPPTHPSLLLQRGVSAFIHNKLVGKSLHLFRKNYLTKENIFSIFVALISDFNIFAMKRIAVLLPLLLLVLSCLAQTKALTPQLNVQGTLKADYKKYEKETPITLTRILRSTDSNLTEHTGTVLVIDINGEQLFMPFKSAAKTISLSPGNTEEFWLCEYIDHKMHELYRKKGYRTQIRQEVAEEANEYLGTLTNASYKDAYIQDYIQHIFTGVAPTHLDERRTDRLRVEILQSPNPDAYMLPNGVLIISTGLLSALDSSEELMAIIASEMTHYVLDHQVRNIAKERARVRKANAWGIALGVAAISAEVALTYNHDHYMPGGLLITAGVANEIMSINALNKMGMGYSDEQFYIADDIALKFLEMNGINTLALGSALYKIASYYKIEKDDYALSQAGGYGNVYKRIKRLGEIKDVGNRSFQRTMSSVNTTNAIIQLNNHNYQAAERLAQKNIDNQFATDDDYLILVKANMSYTNSPEDNQKNLDIIQQILEDSKSPNLGLCKQEILLLLRMQKQSQAANALNEYITMLSDFKLQSLANDDIVWANEELGWANKLYQQIRSF